MTPVETVREQFAFPFDLRPYQAKETNELCEFDRSGYYWQPGSGKTAGSTHQALYWKQQHGIQQWLLVMPPILTLQWERWLNSITDMKTGKALSTTVYAGSPKLRRTLNLESDFILMSYGMLKNDFEYLHEHFKEKSLGILADEATAIKNIESQTHKAVHLIAEGRPLMLLTGTPMNKPGDAYAYMRLIVPIIYRNRRHFEQLHIAETDDYGKPTSWTNLELLADNMRVQTSRVIRREVRAELPDIIYTPVAYSLDPEHLKLYRRITAERLVEFEDGKEIDAISASALRSALQQIVVNWAVFANDESKIPAVMEMIEEVLEEIGDKKLAVVANFRRSNKYLLGALAKHKAVAVYGDITPKGKQQAIHRFITDPHCRVILLQPDSAGFGVDGLQHVCSDMLIVEAPTTPTPFEQVVARLDRDGQQDVIHVRIAIAQGTVQVAMFSELLNKDELINSVQKNYQDLREAVYGE